MMDTRSEFKSAIAATGLTPPETIEPGSIQKFPGFGKDGKNKAAWCLMFEDMRGGVFGDYSSGIESTWQAANSKPYTAAEREAHGRHVQAMRAQRAEERAEIDAIVAENSKNIWGKARPVTGHAYTTRKGIDPIDVRCISCAEVQSICGNLPPGLSGDLLVIPLYRIGCKGIVNLQFIDGSGEKRFMTGGSTAGCYAWVIGGPKPQNTEYALICEGYSTSASANAATGYPVAMALSAGNLPAVAKGLSKKFAGKVKIIIAADDDWKTKGNPGLTKAREAAAAIGAALAVPAFGDDRPDGKTDFNDLHSLSGLEAVKACIHAALNNPVPFDMPPPSSSQIDAEASSKSRVVLTCGADLVPEPVQWLWQDWMALGKFHLLAGAPGQGKTTIAMSMAATVTIGGRWPDGPMVRGA